MEILCPHELWWVQVLPSACRSLPFSALCFSLTDPSGRELREREEEKKKKIKKKSSGSARAI
jgi:hypothetical protein